MRTRPLSWLLMPCALLALSTGAWAAFDRPDGQPPFGLDFAAITLGHIIVGQSHEVLAILRAHERVHVSQYERLGALFLVAYPASSLLAWLRGGSPYHGNRFEQQAVAQAAAQRNAG